MKNCIQCDKELTGRQQKFCSISCKEKWRYANGGGNKLSRQRKRGQEIKAELIQQMGGGCNKCGYNRCQEALDFHHIDPSTKSFPLTKRELGNKSRETIFEEAAKCKLLCANCHREEHHLHS